MWSHHTVDAYDIYLYTEGQVKQIYRLIIWIVYRMVLLLITAAV